MPAAVAGQRMHVAAHEPILDEWVSPRGRVAIITGATSSLGLAASERFAQDGWNVVMGCRDPGRAPVGHGLFATKLDLTSPASIRAFAEEVCARHGRIDALIHNGASLRRDVAPGGADPMFAANVAGPYWLTRLLLEPLRRSDDPRVIVTVTGLADRGRGLGDEEPGFSAAVRGAELARLALSVAMAERWAAEGLTVWGLRIAGMKLPAQMLRRLPPWRRLLARLESAALPSAHAVAESYLALAQAPYDRRLSGTCLSDDLEPLVDLGTAGDPVLQAQVWRDCVTLGEAFARVATSKRAEP
jgi:NAD(P)-dependent dehydrogenase (short-subunit alcohol dehydrogenase family)